MKKSWIVHIVLIGLSILCGGCWDQTELKEVALCVAMSIEQTPDQQFLLSFQVINPGSIVEGQQGGGGGTSSVTTYKSTGVSVAEASRKVTMQLSRKMLFSHMSVIVIDSEIAKQGIKKIFDVFLRDHEMRMQTNVIISRDVPASKLLKLVTTMERIPANQLSQQLILVEKLWGETHHIQIDEVIRQLAHHGKELTVGGVSIAGDQDKLDKRDNTDTIQPASTLITKGIAIFDGDKLWSWLDQEKARGYLWTQKTMKRTALRTDCKGQKDGLTIDINREKSSLRVIKRNNRYVLHVHIQTSGSIRELGKCSNERLENAFLLKLEKQVGKQIQDEIENTLIALQQQKLDAFGFGASIDRMDRKEWRRIEDQWPELFRTAERDVRVEMSIGNTGMTINPTQVE